MKRVSRSAAIAIALLAALLLLAPGANAMSALGDAKIDGEKAEQTVGESIRERANAARDTRVYESLYRLRIGFSVEDCAFLRGEDGTPEGLDADIVAAVFEALGYKSAQWFEEELSAGIDETEGRSERTLLQENDLKLYEFALVPDGELEEALESGRIDMAAGNAQSFAQDDSLLSTKAYYSRRRTVKTHEGEQRDFTGQSFVLVGREGADSLVESLNLKIDALSSDGTVDALEAAYFESGVFARAYAAVRRAYRSVAVEFERNLIREDRYKMLLQGLGTTAKIAAASCVFGVLIGSCVALMRLSGAHIGKWKYLQWISTLYVNVVRGTPVVVQLMIIYYIVLTAPSKTFAAMVTFSLNSAAYVSEMVRGGILAVDKGQTEAGRSLGLSASSTMLLIVLPQTIKIILPSLFNEFIMLLKETSVVGFIGLMDLSKAGDFIRSRTYSAFFPLIAVALVYLVMVTLLTKFFGRIERRLRQSDIR